MKVAFSERVGRRGKLVVGRAVAAGHELTRADLAQFVVERLSSDAPPATGPRR